MHKEKCKGGGEISTYLGEMGIRTSILTDEETHTLVDPPTEEEGRQSLAVGRLNSTLGPDGFSYAVYRRLGDYLVPLLTLRFHEVWIGAPAGTSFREELMTLLHNKGDPTCLPNWRPITLDNIDYMILNRLINSRIKVAAHRFISPGQTSALPGRLIQHTLCLFHQTFEAIQ